MIVALFQFCVSKKNIYNILKCTPIYWFKKNNTSIACIQIKIVVAINVKIYYNKKII